ncbi:uracil-DNA glycosylase [Massilia litorea]|jgi:DNA polymerase|uniref:Uracil-DNA glycosylase n=1 Tax=Massilia litorea TaxID=2769491 RepID=A0A7L9U2T1_9BURK|nr:uracil-DNA glycosylase [Massilia litorea]QOL49288.1 uracil-DNA glycosylase [Massilia litorea]
MNPSERDEVFLAEMGITPLWRLRREPADDSAPVEAEAAAAVAATAPQPAAQSARAPAPAPGVIPPPPRDPAWGEIPMTSAPPPPAWTPPAPPAVEEEQGDSPEAIAAMDWDELRAAIARCTRCGDCAGRKPVYGAGALQARWLVAAGATSAADEAEGAPLAGEAGKLLDNMLCAVDLTREQDVYVTSLVKCRPLSASGGDRAPTAEEAAACRPFLERELALTGAGVVLTLGQIAANGLLGKPLQEPLAGTRGTTHALGKAALVATLHPGELLRRGADKALAWADLCRARTAGAPNARASNAEGLNAGRGR